MTDSFTTKWSQINNPAAGAMVDETSLYVPPGKEPITQRQLNLYYYFIFIRDILHKVNARKVLEVGCGRSTISLYLATYLGLNVAMLDNQPDAIEIAQKEFARFAIPAEFYVADALHTNLPETAFDATVSIGLAEHLDDVPTLFAEQYRLLKPGGVMISLNIPKKFSVQYLNRPFRLVQKWRGQFYGSIKKDYYRNKLKTKDYVAIAKEVGFKDVEVTEVCPFPVYTPLRREYDKKVTNFNKWILKIRGVFQKYPYKTNRIFSQAHFLVGYK